MKKRYLRLVRQALKALRHRRLRNQQWWKTLTLPVRNRRLWIPCRDSVATGMSIGLFLSMMLMPFQMPPAALLAMRLRANVPIAMGACWVSNPLSLPAILYAQCRLGQWFKETLALPVPDFINVVSFEAPGLGSFNAASFILGMFVSGILLALCAYPLVHLFSAIMPQHLPVRRRKTRLTEKNAPPPVGRRSRT